MIDGLREIGAFGIKIPQEYGGLGLTQTSYTHAIGMVTSEDGNLTALLSAHQSIGVPQPLKLFGTEEQKKKYLPRLAKGAISRLRAHRGRTSGSDPADLRDARATLSRGRHALRPQRREALVHQRHARRAARGDGDGTGSQQDRSRRSSSRPSWPGVEVVHRCHFMGLKAIENGVIRFTNVKVPGENLLWGEGKGLKLALITLNTGRLTLPASCAAAGEALPRDRRGAGRPSACSGAQPIGKHDAIAQKLGADGGEHLRDGGGRRPGLAAWPTAADSTSASRRRWPRCGTPRSAGGSSTTRCRSAAAAATRPPTACASRGERRIRSSG